MIYLFGGSGSTLIAVDKLYDNQRERGVIEQIVADLANTMEICGRTVALINKHGLSPYCVATDAGGGGKQIADRMIEQGYDMLLVGFGEASDARQTHRNRRAELYGTRRGGRRATGWTAIRRGLRWGVDRRLVEPGPDCSTRHLR